MDPFKQNRLGDSIKADKNWYTEVGLVVMKEGLMAKFSQSKRLGQFLATCKRYTLVECNAKDTFWGIGLPIMSEAIGDCTLWKGKNMLGVTYADVMKLIKL
jgi:ribA/ribD-fused uncharacterized protein